MTRVTTLGWLIVAVAVSIAAAGALDRRSLGGGGQPPPRGTNSDHERARVHYRLGLESLSSEKWDDAVREFRAAIDLYPKFTLAHYALGKAYMGLKQYANAAAAYEQCRELYLTKAGDKFSGQFDANRARQDRLMELKDLQQQQSKGPQTMQTQEAQRQIQNAIRLTQEAVDRGLNLTLDTSVPAFVSVALGSAYFRSERMADAEREYKEALQDDPKAGEAHNNLAVVYMLTDRLDGAAREMTLAEKSGFRVNPQFKKDLEDRRKARR